MTERVPLYLFEPDRVIGTVVEVGPDYVRTNLPLAAAQEPQLQHGERVGAGEVGEFVVVEAGDVGIFGRLTVVRLPERDRLSVEPQIGRRSEPHPVGVVQLLTTIPLTGELPTRGITRFPRVGARVFSLHPSVVTWITEHAGGSEDAASLRLDLAFLSGTTAATVRVTPERLFGRHCAVLGATGAGKSWSLARIIERCAEFNAKVVLLDATGEYHRLSNRVRHVALGQPVDRPDGTASVVLPYRVLEEMDLFALLRPSGQVQVPRMRSAIKSLKLAGLLGDDPLVDDGCIPKADRPKAPFDAAYASHAAAIENAVADFDIHKLARQIELECVWPSAFGQRQGQRDHSRWGGQDEASYSNCTTLIARLEGYLGAPEFAPIFQPEGAASVFDAIESFFGDESTSVLRISLRHLSFKQNVREIVANGLGRWLLAAAREERFSDRPVVVCLDEAHQFLNKWLGDEFSRYPLDAFDLIAKEGRKYSLSICIATQRPRDIPEGILGQMGTLVVHRLTNDRDREIVERASGDIDRSAAAFLPSLAPGQALLLGVDYPIPLIIQVSEPSARPDSAGPDFQSHWRRRGDAGNQRSSGRRPGAVPRR